MKSRSYLAVAWVCFCTSASLTAEPAAQPTDTQTALAFNNSPSTPAPFSVAFFWENDGSILKRNNATDRHYTNGNAVTFAHRPDWAEAFADIATLGEAFDRTAAGYILGHMIFTPEDISATQLIRNDRPYAGYLFAGVYVQRANDNTFDHAQLDLGLVGPSSYAEHFQKDIHDFLDLDEPKGWDNQLEDEPTAQLTLRRKWRQDPASVRWGGHEWSHQLIPQVELAVGSIYRHVAAGVTWRIGHNLPDDFGPGRLADVADATGGPTQRWGAYGFLRAAGKISEHNLFLEGNSFKDSHGVDGNTLVGEVQVGVAAHYRYRGWNIQTNYSQTFISEEFDGQDGSDAYGALMLAASKGF